MVCFASSPLARAADLNVQASISSKRPCLGDPVVLQIAVEQSVEKQPEIDTTALETLGAKQLGEPAFGHQRTIINGVSSEKFTFQFRFQFTPSKVGSLKIPAVTVRQGKETAATTPIEIHVLAVPKVGQPDTFTGGIGVFKVTAAAQPTKVCVGDPITLTLRVTGSGNLEDLGPPNLTAQERWTRDFKVHDDPSPGRVEENAKVFTFSVRPKSAEAKDLPAVRFSYFNPKLKKYEDTYTERIPLEVSETARFDPAEIVDSAADRKSSRELAEVAGGLAANYTGPDVLDAQGPYYFAPATLATLILAPPAVWIATFLLHRRAVNRRRNPARLRAQGAYRRATDRIEALSRLPRELRTEEAARALAGYLADRLNLPAGELTPAEARQHLLDLGAGVEQATEFANLVERCDQARFGRSQAGGDADDLRASALTLLGRVERATSNSGRRGTLAAAARSLVFLAVVPNPDITKLVADQPLDRHAVLARANAAFERGARAADAAAAQQAFREAIAAYEGLASDGVDNGKLYYNLANAYFRVGDAPRAILYYRLAERLLPRDGQVAANLAFVRSRVTDRIEPTETSRLLRQLLFPHYSWSVRERTQAAAATFLVTWFVLGVRIWRPRRWLTAFGVFCLAVSASLAYSVHVQLEDDDDHPIGVLIANDVVVRTGDGETYEPQFNRSLGAGIEFRVRERREEWLQIELPDGKTGWVRADQTEIADRMRFTTQQFSLPPGVRWASLMSETTPHFFER